MKKVFIHITIVCLVVIIVIYNVIDNNRINVRYDEVRIPNLPSSFDGFTILQITDLHGKRFGNNQEDLINIINDLNYDMIVITGDIQNKHEDNIDAFLEFMEGINNKEDVFFVFGNSDNEKYYNDIKSSGCNMLDEPVKIVRGNDKIYIRKYDFREEIDRNNITIGLTHIPIPLDIGYDFIIAGHYHGGQYRIPLYGALFVPDINGNCLFPKQSDVSGVQDFGCYKQYISRGLGASSRFKFLEFRLFNTPEINLLTLRGE